MRERCKWSRQDNCQLIGFEVRARTTRGMIISLVRRTSPSFMTLMPANKPCRKGTGHGRHPADSRWIWPVPLDVALACASQTTPPDRQVSSSFSHDLGHGKAVQLSSSDLGGTLKSGVSVRTDFSCCSAATAGSQCPTMDLDQTKP